MKIEKIEIKNYKALEDIIVEFDDYFSSISGQNNAGKTSIVKAISSIFKGDDDQYSLFDEDLDISYSRSKTQWVSDNDPIEFKYQISVSRNSDPGIHSFVKKIAEIDTLPDISRIEIHIVIHEKEERKIGVFVDGVELGKYETGEVFRRLSSSNIVSMHNSTSNHRRIYSPRGAFTFLLILSCSFFNSSFSSLERIIS